MGRPCSYPARMQTSREVIDNLIRNKPAERVGLNDNPWGQTVKKWIGQGYPTDAEGKPVPVGDHFGFDMMGCGGWFPWQAKLIDPEIVEESDEWKIVRDGSGASLKQWKERPGTPEHIDFQMNSREIWEQEYKPHVLGSSRARFGPNAVETVKSNLAEAAEKRRWAQYGNLFIWEGMRKSLGDINLYENLLLDPGWINDYCRTYTDVMKECYRILLDEVGKPDGVWMYEDLGYKNATFCSPEVYKNQIFPFYAEMIEFFHSYDLPVVLHSCGFTEPILDLIVDVGFDALNPMEVKAGNDIFRIADGYSDKLAFIGGLDARVLESGDRDLIRRSVSELIEGMKSRGARFVFGSDHSLSTSVDYDDFRFALDVYREHMMY